MDEIYNLSGLMNDMNNGGGLSAFARNANLGLYWYGWFILFIVSFIMFLYLKGKGWQAISAIATTLFMDVILCWFMVAIQLVDVSTLWVCLFLFVISSMGLYLSNRE